MIHYIIHEYFIFRLYNNNNSYFISKTLETQAFITTGFILFTILTSNPFQKMTPEQSNGLGFNPILQDPALAIHPPILYVGYVGTSIIFSLSLAAIVKKNITKGKDKGKMRLRQMQWKAAEGGNVSMLIWLGKQVLGQSDKQELELIKPIEDINFDGI